MEKILLESQEGARKPDCTLSTSKSPATKAIDSTVKQARELSALKTGVEIKDIKNSLNDEQKSSRLAAEDDDLSCDTKHELEAINKQKTEIEMKLKEMNEKNLQRLLYISPSPETLPETEKFANEEAAMEGGGHLRPLIFESTNVHGSPPTKGSINPNLRVNRGPLRPRDGNF